MKIRHADLETARKDPLAWRRTMGQNTGGFFIPYNILLLTIHHYHQKGENDERAESYLRTSYERHFDNVEELSRLMRRLKGYIEAYRSQIVRAISTRVRISHPIGPDVFLTGEIARLDLIPGDGYVALLLAPRSSGSWRDQLRMPLLQDWVATRFGVSPVEVAVGFYYFDEETYDRSSYSVTEIANALNEATRIGRVLADAQIRP